MELRLINSVDEFDDIGADWDALVAKLDPVPLPLTHAWLRSWWGSFGSGKEMVFRCIYRSGTMIGAAPLLRTRERYRGLMLNVVQLAANGHTPFSGVLVDPTITGNERIEALTELTQIAAGEFGLFFKIHKDGELRHFLIDRLKSRHLRGGEKPGVTTPVINFDRDWDTFYASRSRKMRKSLNHKLNRFRKDGSFTISEEPITGDDQSILQEIITISANSWKASIGKDLRSNASSREFIAQLAGSLQPGMFSAWIMRQDERPVAFELHITCDNIVYPIRADFDESFKKASPGSVLEYTALKHLFENRAGGQYFTCADDYWYLSNWTSDYRQFANIEVFGVGLQLRLLYLLEYKLIPRVKKLLGKSYKQARPA